MAEPRKIVLILGNGFDLDLGLKTSYKAFWESKFCPKTYPSPLISFLNGNLGQTIDDVRWYDMENALLKYAEIVSSPLHLNSDLFDSDIRFLKEFDSNSPDRGFYPEYNREIDNLIKKGYVFTNPKNSSELIIPYQDDLLRDFLWRDKRALALIKEGLCDYLNSIKYEREARDTSAYQVLQFLALEGEEKSQVAIYSFNYTNAKHYVYSAKDTDIHYMHGSCSDGQIIIGTRDDKRIIASYDFLQKSFDTSFNPPALVADLQDADEVVIFGHSIGENDRQYFKAFFLQQTNFANTRRKDIVIFTRDIASEFQIKRSLESMTDWNLSTLFGLNNLQIIKTGDIKEDQEKLFNFLIKHGKEEMATREFIGKLLAKESAQ